MSNIPGLIAGLIKSRKLLYKNEEGNHVFKSWKGDVLSIPEAEFTDKTNNKHLHEFLIKLL